VSGHWSVVGNKGRITTMCRPCRGSSVTRVVRACIAWCTSCVLRCCVSEREGTLFSDLATRSIRSELFSAIFSFFSPTLVDSIPLYHFLLPEQSSSECVFTTTYTASTLFFSTASPPSTRALFSPESWAKSHLDDTVEVHGDTS